MNSSGDGCTDGFNNVASVVVVDTDDATVDDIVNVKVPVIMKKRLLLIIISEPTN